MNNIYETGERPKDFVEFAMIALWKKPKATKCSDHLTMSLIAHAAKIVAKILRRRIERKIQSSNAVWVDIQYELPRDSLRKLQKPKV
jgi:hypothetical protein